MLPNCVNKKNLYMFSYVFQKLCWFRAKKITFEMRKTQYSIALYSIEHTRYKVVWIAHIFYGVAIRQLNLEKKKIHF